MLPRDCRNKLNPMNRYASRHAFYAFIKKHKKATPSIHPIHSIQTIKFGLQIIFPDYNKKEIISWHTVLLVIILKVSVHALWCMNLTTNLNCPVQTDRHTHTHTHTHYSSCCLSALCCHMQCVAIFPCLLPAGEITFYLSWVINN